MYDYFSTLKYSRYVNADRFSRGTAAVFCLTIAVRVLVDSTISQLVGRKTFENTDIHIFFPVALLLS